MPRSRSVYQILDAVTVHGLIARGGFHFSNEEDVPNGPSGLPARSVLLVGNASDAFWPHFRRWQARQPAGLADPLDTWSRAVLEAVAGPHGARVILPNDRPYAPFQQWAMRAEGLKPSPLGVLMHPRYGLWHAWRGALLFDKEIDLRALNRVSQPPIHLCDACVGKPCLIACPVAAFDGGQFAYGNCLSHISGVDGGDCVKGGCLARNACPEATGYRYSAEAQAFFMAAFSRAGRRENRGTRPRRFR